MIRDKLAKRMSVAVCAALMCIAVALVAVVISASGAAVDKGMDRTAPQITVDWQGYDPAQLPVGIVGVRYPVFTGEAEDYMEGSVPLSIRIYKAYTNKNLYDAGTRSFTPDSAQTYILEYSAKDSAGNESVHKYGIKVLNSVAVPVISTVPTSVSAVTGEAKELPHASVTGGSGKAIESVEISLGGNVVYSGASLTGAVFTPTRNGEYDVKYTAVDYLGRKDEKTFSLSASTGDGPIIALPHMPESVVYGTEIDFGGFSATDYAGENPVAAETEISVSYAGNTGVLSSTKYVPAKPALKSEDMVVTFTARGDSGVSTEQRTITVVNNVNESGRYVLANYLALKNATADDSRPMKAVSENPGATAEFANDVLADGGRLAFTYDGMTDFTVILSDAQNSDVRAEIKVEKSKSSGMLDVYVNGAYIERNTRANADGVIMLSYVQSTKLLRFNVNGDSTLEDYTTIQTNCDGSAFNGFESGKIRYKLVFGTKASGANQMSFDITRINGLTVSAATVTDNAGPEIAVPSYKRRHEKGDTAVLPAGVAEDVLNSVKNFTVSVTAPDGTNVLQNADATQAQSFSLSQYGSYIIVYTAVDTADRSATNRFSLYVTDRVPPVITLGGDVTESGSVGETIALPSFTVTDETTDVRYVSSAVIIVTPKYEFKALTKDDNGNLKFTPTCAGVYTVRYIAEDTDGNVTKIEKTIVVKEITQ